MTLQSLPWYTLAVLIVMWLIDQVTKNISISPSETENVQIGDNQSGEIFPVVPTPNVELWQKINERFAREDPKINNL